MVFLKGFLKVMLWLTSISALCISLFVMTNYNSDKVDVSKNGTSVLELEKRIAELEEQNKQMEKEVEYAQYSAENHIHLQYDVIDRYRYQDTYDWIEIKPKHDDTLTL